MKSSLNALKNIAIPLAAAGGMAFLLVAGIGKLLAPEDFRNSLSGWKLIPTSLVPFLTIAIPATETLMAGLWFVGVLRRPAAIAAFCFVLAVTVLYCCEWLLLAPPRCSCLGLWSHFWVFRDSGRTIVIRNVVILAMLAAAMAPARVRAKTNDEALPSPVGARGFTLVELLLVIAIMAVLISLSLPSFAKFRKDADRTVLRAKLTGHVAAFTAYTSDFREYWPYLTDPKATYSILRSPPDIALRVDYFEAYAFWHIPLSHTLYRKSWNDPVFKERRGDEPLVTGIWYSIAFLVDPKFYGYGTRTGMDQCRATKVSEVRFPSRKALFTCNGTYSEAGQKEVRLPMAFVDGSGEFLREGEWREGNPDGALPFSPRSSSFQPGLHTWGGVWGRDRN